MTRRVPLALGIAVLLAAPVRAELRYTLTLEVKTPPKPVRQTNLGDWRNIGDWILRTIAPTDREVTQWLVGDRGAWVEDARSGTVTWLRADGSVVGLNVSEKAYWIVKNDQRPLRDWELKTRVTDEHLLVQGVRAQRTQYSVSVPWNFGDQQPTQHVRVEVEAWMSPTSIVPGVINQQGLPLLQIWRSDSFGDREIHATVTDIGVIDTPGANAFVLPATYRQVPPPSGLKR